MSTSWQAALKSPGGLIEFVIERISESESNDGELYLHVGDEKIKVDQGVINAKKMVLSFPHYDSKIEAKYDQTAGQYIGKWTKRQSKTKFSSLPFSAKPMAGGKNPKSVNQKIGGRWKVDFEKSDDPAVGIFKVESNGRATGTFLTTTGDYRFLGGTVDGDQLTLSCFDGAHAFLFRARIGTDGKLSGTFWSRDSWKEKWAATKDPNAKLPDAFKLTKWNSNVPLSKTKVHRLDGSVCSLADKKLLGKNGTLIYVFGSWCPNCHDAGEYLAKLYKKHKNDGINVVGVAFELTEDLKRSTAQVKIYLQRHKTDFPVVIGGRADLGKAAATKQFHLIDRIRSYPTTIFVNPDQSILAIHTGFSGPATGKAYEELKKKFEAIINQWLQQK